MLYSKGIDKDIFFLFFSYDFACSQCSCPFNAEIFLRGVSLKHVVYSYQPQPNSRLFFLLAATCQTQPFFPSILSVGWYLYQSSPNSSPVFLLASGVERSFCSPIISVADPDPGSGTFLTPGSGMGKKSRSGSGMDIQDHISESLKTIFWVKILNFFDADPESFWPWIQDGNSDKRPRSATLPIIL
jgi:hypothetical protein